MQQGNDGMSSELFCDPACPGSVDWDIPFYFMIEPGRSRAGHGPLAEECRHALQDVARVPGRHDSMPLRSYPC